MSLDRDRACPPALTPSLSPCPKSSSFERWWDGDWPNRIRARAAPTRVVVRSASIAKMVLCSAFKVNQVVQSQNVFSLFPFAQSFQFVEAIALLYLTLELTGGSIVTKRRS